MKAYSAIEENPIKTVLFFGLFLMVWVMNLVLFRYSFFNLTFFAYSLFNFFIVSIIFVVLSKIITSILNPIKWIIFILAFFLLSLLARYALSIPLKYLLMTYPEDKLLFAYYKTYNIHSFNDIFESHILIYQLYIHLNLFFVASMILKYTHSLKKISELSVINANQELNLLKSQIHPHFLFNTLNNLYRLVMSNEQAGEVVLKLSETLRFTLYETNKDSIPLKTEIKFVENYIELEKINQNGNVDISYDFNEIDNREILIAPMIFIPLVDNALKQGVINCKDTSRIEIKLRQSQHNIFFEIKNSRATDPNASNIQAQELYDFRKRLDKIYPDKYTLEIGEDDFFKANLTFHLD